MASMLYTYVLYGIFVLDDNGFTPFEQPPPPQNNQTFISTFDDSTNISQSSSFVLFANQSTSNMNSSQQPISLQRNQGM